MRSRRARRRRRHGAGAGPWRDRTQILQGGWCVVWSRSRDQQGSSEGQQEEQDHALAHTAGGEERRGVEQAAGVGDDHSERRGRWFSVYLFWEQGSAREMDTKRVRRRRFFCWSAATDSSATMKVCRRWPLLLTLLNLMF